MNASDHYVIVGAGSVCRGRLGDAVIVRGCTNAATIMIAEKAADLIKETGR